MKYRSALPAEQNALLRELKFLNAKRTPGTWQGEGDYVWVGDNGVEFERDDADTQFLALVTRNMDTILAIIESRYVVL